MQNALSRYNEAADALNMPQLTWEEVVDYTFLAEFDILRDTRAEVRSRPWTRPTYRLAMDKFFKIQRAREEIPRLNMEIRRLITWIRDENRVLRAEEESLRNTNGKTEEQIEKDLSLAVQVKLYRERRSRFDATHIRRFKTLSKLTGFTGTLKPGKALEQLKNSQNPVLSEDDPMDEKDEEDDGSEGRDSDDKWETARDDGSEGRDSDDEGETAQDEAVSGMIYQVSMMGIDGPTQVRQMD